MKKLIVFMLVLVLGIFCLASCDLTGGTTPGGDKPGGEVVCEHTGGSATCASKAVCSKCGEAYGDYSTTHSPETEWSYADGKHYHACAYGCSQRFDEAACDGVATCKDAAKCSVCGNERGTVDSTKHVISEKWTSVDGLHYRECENGCGKQFDVGFCDKSEADCNNPAACKVCGKTYGDPIPCQVSTEWRWSVNEDGQLYHYHACENGCDKQYDAEVCNGDAPTCTAAGNCDKCGGAPIDPNNHKAATEWTPDTDGTHYHACENGCDEKFDVTECVFENATCVAEGECADCGNTGVDTVNGHSPSEEFTAGENGTHYRECENGCDAKLDVTECVFGNATCVTEGECADCGNTGVDTVNGHSPSEEFTAGENGTHYRECENGCGEKLGLAECEFTGATCMTKGVCELCGNEGEVDPDVHDPSEEFTADEDGVHHYNVCENGCDNKLNVTECMFENATCVIEGECALCGNTGFDTVYGHDPSEEFTVGQDGTHYNKCNYGCDEKFNVTDCEHSCGERYCPVCGYDFGFVKEHDYTNWTSTGASVTAECANGCGKKITTNSVGGTVTPTTSDGILKLDKKGGASTSLQLNAGISTTTAEQIKFSFDFMVPIQGNGKMKTGNVRITTSAKSPYMPAIIIEESNITLAARDGLAVEDMDKPITGLKGNVWYNVELSIHIGCCDSFYVEWRVTGSDGSVYGAINSKFAAYTNKDTGVPATTVPYRNVSYIDLGCYNQASEYTIFFDNMSLLVDDCLDKHPGVSTEITGPTDIDFEGTDNNGTPSSGLTAEVVTDPAGGNNKVLHVNKTSTTDSQNVKFNTIANGKYDSVRFSFRFMIPEGAMSGSEIRVLLNSSETWNNSPYAVCIQTYMDGDTMKLRIGDMSSDRSKGTESGKTPSGENRTFYAEGLSLGAWYDVEIVLHMTCCHDFRADWVVTDGDGNERTFTSNKIVNREEAKDFAVKNTINGLYFWFGYSSRTLETYLDDIYIAVEDDANIDDHHIANITNNGDGTHTFECNICTDGVGTQKCNIACGESQCSICGYDLGYILEHNFTNWTGSGREITAECANGCGKKITTNSVGDTITPTTSDGKLKIDKTGTTASTGLQLNAGITTTTAEQIKLSFGFMVPTQADGTMKVGNVRITTSTKSPYMPTIEITKNSINLLARDGDSWNSGNCLDRLITGLKGDVWYNVELSIHITCCDSFYVEWYVTGDDGSKYTAINTRYSANSDNNGVPATDKPYRNVSYLNFKCCNMKEVYTIFFDNISLLVDDDCIDVHHEISDTATSDGAGKHYYACADCDTKFFESDCTVAEEWSHGIDANGNAYHYHACIDGCGYEFDKAICVLEGATCVTEGTCAVCGNVGLNDEAHNISEAFTQGENGTHYHACEYGCGERFDEAECVFEGATCVTEGTCAVCGNEGVSAEGHKWSDSFTADGSGAHYRTCEYGCNEKADEGECVTDGAACNVMGVCDVCGSEGYYGNVHVTDDSKWIADEDGAHHYHACANGCDAKLDVTECMFIGEDCLLSCEFCENTSINNEKHNASTEWSFDPVKDTHYHECLNGCGERIGEENCIFIFSTCTVASPCLVCDNVSEAANHRPTAEWTADENGTHYRECLNGCGEKLDVTKCTFSSATCVTEAKCDYCDNNGLNPEGHKPAAEWTADEDGTHYRECEYECGEKLDVTECEFVGATCQTKGVCELCGNVGDVDPETHTQKEGAVAIEGALRHASVCSECGTSLGEYDCTFSDATCSNESKCDYCDHTGFNLNNHKAAEAFTSGESGTHYRACEYGCDKKLDVTECEFTGATCTTKSKCEVCGNEDAVDPENHKPAAEWTLDTNATHYHACEYGCDAKLDVTPCSPTCISTKCTVGGEELGYMLDHEYEWTEDSSGNVNAGVCINGCGTKKKVTYNHQSNPNFNSYGSDVAASDATKDNAIHWHKETNTNDVGYSSQLWIHNVNSSNANTAVTGNKIVISFNFYLDSAVIKATSNLGGTSFNTLWRLRPRNENNTVYTMFSIGFNNSTSTWWIGEDNNSSKQYGAFSLDTWYNIKFVFDMTSGTMEARVNDEYLFTHTVNGTAVTSIQNLYFEAMGRAFYDAYFDDFIFYTVE